MAYQNVTQMSGHIVAVRNGSGLYGVVSMAGQVQYPRSITVSNMQKLFEFDVGRKLVFVKNPLFFYGTKNELAKFYERDIPYKLGQHKDREYSKGYTSQNDLGHLLVSFDDNMQLKLVRANAIREVENRLNDYILSWISKMEYIIIDDLNDRRVKHVKIPKRLKEAAENAGGYYHTKNQKVKSMGDNPDFLNLAFSEDPLGILPEDIAESIWRKGHGLPPKEKTEKEIKSDISAAML